MSKEIGDIVEIRDILKNEFQRFASINTVLKETSEGFDKIDETYHTYGSEIDTSKTHLLKLKRREFYENLFIYIGFVIFFLCVIYVILKRFPVHIIIYLLNYTLSFLVSMCLSGQSLIIKTVFNNNSSISNMTFNSTNVTFPNEEF